MNEQDWNGWCLSVTKRLGNIEKSLTSYHKTQKRMLYVLAIGFTAVLINGLLLFYQ